VVLIEDGVVQVDTLYVGAYQGTSGMPDASEGGLLREIFGIGIESHIKNNIGETPPGQ
jgi:hypothetical protein